MKKLLLTILLIAAFSWACTLLFPWWIMAVVAFFSGFLFRLKPGKSFLAGFLAIAGLWSVLLIKADTSNEQLLSGRMAQLFSLPGSAIFIAVNVLLGALIGGLSAWSGALLRRAFFSRQPAPPAAGVPY